MKILLENVNAIIFVCGLGLLYCGAAAVSWAVANVLAGSILMGCATCGAVWPYLSRQRKS